MIARQMILSSAIVFTAASTVDGLRKSRFFREVCVIQPSIGPQLDLVHHPTALYCFNNSRAIQYRLDSPISMNDRD